MAKDQQQKHDVAGAKAASSKMRGKEFEKELAKLQVELTRLQTWVQATVARIIVVFERRDQPGRAPQFRIAIIMAIAGYGEEDDPGDRRALMPARKMGSPERTSHRKADATMPERTTSYGVQSMNYHVSSVVDGSPISASASGDRHQGSRSGYTRYFRT
jgi:hypothetical protein